MVSSDDTFLSSGRVGLAAPWHSDSSTKHYWQGVGTDGDPAPTELLPPDPPTGFTLTTTDHETQEGNWNASDDTNTYEMQHADNDEFVDALLIDDITSLSQQVDNLTPDTTYWARVRACNESGCSDWSDADSATTDPQPIDADVSLSLPAWSLSADVTVANPVDADVSLTLPAWTMAADATVKADIETAVAITLPGWEISAFIAGPPIPLHVQPGPSAVMSVADGPSAIVDVADGNSADDLVVSEGPSATVDMKPGPSATMGVRRGPRTP